VEGLGLAVSVIWARVMLLVSIIIAKPTTKRLFLLPDAAFTPRLFSDLFVLARLYLFSDMSVALSFVRHQCHFCSQFGDPPNLSTTLNSIFITRRFSLGLRAR